MSTFPIMRVPNVWRRSWLCRRRHNHDLRHSFAVRTMLDSYRCGRDAAACQAALSTYLGHVDPAASYWYLSAAPELLSLAAARLEHNLTEACP